MKPLIGITIGDSNGIGYELILRSLIDKNLFDICVPIIYGNASHIRLYLSVLKEDKYKGSLHTITNPLEARDGFFNIIECYNDMPLQMGKITVDGGKAALKSLQRAVADIKAGVIEALVTCPINKQNIQCEEFHFAGHTEYLSHCFDSEEKSLMLLVNDVLKVALVTNHVAIKDISQHLMVENILTKIHLLKRTLQLDFSIEQPRIAVLALNPHAGDKGLFGGEEEEIITPAILQAQEEGLVTFGPFSPDGFFGTEQYRSYDAVLAMYHDQGLIPFKLLDMGGVNFTAGLPIVRTSPDHGTAYDLVGQGTASTQPFKNAVYLAIDVLKRRKENMALEANALHVVPKPKAVAPVINLAEELKPLNPPTMGA